MPWIAGSYVRTDGVYSGATVFQEEAGAGIDMEATNFDAEGFDMAQGVDACLNKNGANSPTADIAMGGFKFTGVGNASARNQYATVDQVQDNDYLFAAAGGTADAITAAFSPALTALVDGMEVCVRASGANTITAPTFIPNGVGSALTITKFGGQALNIGDIYGAGHELRLRYRTSATRWELLNPATAATGNLPRSYLAGFGLANNVGDATNDIDVAIGTARDSANAADITLAAALTKRLDAAWVVGTNQGMLATGVAIANGTYHLFAIRRPDTGVVDIAADSSVTGANIATNTNAAYTQIRRIGSILRESAAIVAFKQLGDEFLRSASILDITAANPGTSAVSRTLSVPTGLQLAVLFNFNLTNNGAGVSAAVLFSELDRADEAPSATAAPLLNSPAGSTSAGQVQIAAAAFRPVRTNTSAQIRSRLLASDASCTLYIATFGWIDRRGRDS